MLEKWFHDPIKTMFAHRLEIGFGYFEFGITEIQMVGGKSPALRDGNPFIFFHNNYESGSSSYGVGVDAKVKLPEKFILFGELFLDELKEADDGGSPTTLGWEAGIQHAFEVGEIPFFHNFHIVQTDPFLYNHSLPYLKLYSRQVIKSNFIELGSRPFIDAYVIDYPLGYFRGPDVLDLWYELTGFFTEKVSGSLESGVLRQGEKDPHSLLEDTNPGSPTGIQEKELRIILSAEYRHNTHLTAGLGYGIQYLQNLHHLRDNDTVRQQVFGRVTWSWK